jgi:IPT/TIG domain
MAVFYGVPAGKTMMISGPADVTVRGGETPLIVDDAADVEQAAPAVSALDPSTAETGAADLLLTISGTNFSESSVIVFGNNDEPTTLTPDGTVTTMVKPSLFAPAAVPVTVRNGPARSQPMDFTFTDPAKTNAAA